MSNAKRNPHFETGKFGLDHVEALLGWFIYLTWQYDMKFGEPVHDMLDMLNQALFSAWVLGTFFPSDR